MTLTTGGIITVIKIFIVIFNTCIDEALVLVSFSKLMFPGAIRKQKDNNIDLIITPTKLAMHALCIVT